MIFIYIVFIWLIAMIAYNVWKGRNEKKQMTISREERKKYFNGRYLWK